MNFKNGIKKVVFAFAALASASSAPAQSQAEQTPMPDKLAMQAPTDKKSKALDSIVIKEIIVRESNLENPSEDLYTSWNTHSAHVSMPVPDEFEIDLREFSMPTHSRVVTSNFGPRWNRTHKGLDIKVYTGDPIYSAFPGKVRVVKNQPRGYGKYIVIRHDNGLETVYAHLSKQLVTPGQIVESGQVIGLGGNTGRSTGSHLHFETRLCGKALNPALMFDFRNQDVTGDTYVYRSETYDRESNIATSKRGKIGNGSYTPEMVRGNAKPVGNPSASHNTSANKNSRHSYAKTSSTTRRSYHKVRKGDTLYSIARKHNTTVARLKKANRINGTNLRLGQTIRIK